MRIPYFSQKIDQAVQTGVERKVLEIIAGKNMPDQYEGSRGWDYLWGIVKKWSFNWQQSNSVFVPLQTLELENAFEEHPVVRACVNAVMAAASKVRWEVGRWVNQEWSPLASHPMLELLEMPNKCYNRVEFMQYTSGRYVLTGATYILKLRNGSRKVGELWPLPTSNVQCIGGKGANLVAGYKVGTANELVIPEDMLAGRIPSLGSTVGYCAPLNAAFRDFRLDQERENYLAEMLVNMKLPSMVVRPKKSLTPAQMAETRLALDDRIGKGKRGNALVVGGETEVDIVNPLADLDWPGLTSLIETRICAAFGVPPIVVHLRSGLDRATYSNYEQALQAFYQGTMVSVWDSLAAIFTHHLLRMEGEPLLEFRARYDEMPEFVEDANGLSARTVAEFKEGILKCGEARERLGCQPDEAWEKEQDKPEPPPTFNVPGKPGEPVPPQKGKKPVANEE